MKARQLHDQPCAIVAGGDDLDRAILVGVLVDQGFHVVETKSRDGLGRVEETEPDVAVVDVRDDASFGLIDELAAAGVPTAVIGGPDHTDRGAAEARGSAAYFVRPVVAATLVATVRSLVRRRRLATAGPVLRFDPLVVDVTHRRVTVGSRSVHLTPKEFDLLADLAGSAGRILPIRELLRDVWHAEPGQRDARTVAVHVRRVRQKLEAAGLAPCIRTIRGEGYVFVPF